TEMFKTKLNVDEEVANILVQEGFASLDEVAYVPASELARIEEFDEDVIEELRNRARDVLLAQAIASEEVAETSGFNKDILDVVGMTGELAVKLANEGIAHREALAELATDELTELTGMGDEEAAAMIMSAREIWFADEAESTGSDAAEAAEAK
ncbi:MAG TPA: helix-hairpin-helix domain-containing protein, partial [Gammaproteobacteria bacterium]|nr:helix-hairpin-helix domain-containing protein [Gammaproteobacteria bacterium]